MRVVGVALALATASALTLAVGAPESASASVRAADAAALLVSADGATYSSDPTFALFADIGRVIPGDAVTEPVWVRSTAGLPGRLRIDLVDVRADDADLAAATTVALSLNGRVLGSVSLAAAGPSCTLVTDAPVLAPGQTQRLDATMAVAADLGERPGQDGRAGADGQVSFHLRATLSDATVPAAPADVCALTPTPAPRTETAGALSVTGARTPIMITIAGLLAFAVGGILLGRRRRTPEDA